MLERVEGGTYAPLCESIVEHLEAAVLVLDGAPLHLLHANQFAREALQIARGELPRPVLAELASWFAEEPPRHRFAAARTLTAPNGQRFHARAKRLDPWRPEVMLILTPHEAGDREVGAVLRERFGLSLRELQVVQALRAGMTNSEIALRLGLSEGTVKNYLSRAFGAIGVRSRTHLLALLRSLEPEP